MISAGIAGGAGYTAGELIRILLEHEQVDLKFVISKSHAGRFLSNVHADLLGDTEMVFSHEVTVAVDVLFLCMGHGKSKSFVESESISNETKIIDLSQDHRYKGSEFVYGLPELNLDLIKHANKVANPGCFATAIQLSILPLANAKILNTDVHINAVTGSSGAGQQPSSATHFSWRSNNVSVYKPFEHQHLYEIKESLKSLDGEIGELLFIPQRGAFTRGILATSYMSCALDITEIKRLFQDYYKEAAFVLITEDELALKQVINTNKCVLKIEKFKDNLFITCAIDNLIKGASGQAVQNMNIMFGLSQKMGLKMKAVAF